jgi:hypothetical protein
LSGSPASRPTYSMLGKVAVPSEIEKPIAMFPFWSIAALPIHLCIPSAGAYVPCCAIHQLALALARLYQRIPARSEPTSTVWLTTICS